MSLREVVYMSTKSKPSFSSGREILITIVTCVFIVAVTVIILRIMGRPLICTCGTIKLWHGEVISSENSQHISDWYSVTHAVHGILFYFLLWLISRTFPWLRGVQVRLILAVAIESVWEVFENTDFIINRYREATIALDYFGDSVINSTADILFMSLGFLIASRLPVIISASIAVTMEVLMLIMIRDNLALNILMLIWPVEEIKNWQIG